MNGPESGFFESTEEQMKSVVRDFESKGYSGLEWVMAIFFVTCLAGGAIGVFTRISEKVHLQGLSFHNLFQIVSLPLLFILPLMFSLLIWRYISSALTEIRVSEGVAKNTILLTKLMIFFVYYAYFQLALWN
jgi:hypothetical protein